MRRFSIVAVGLALAIVGALLSTHWSLGQAQPVASITLPEPGETKQLYPGCNNISLTFPDGTATDAVVQAVAPTGSVQAVWRHNPAMNSFEGFAPTAPQASDLLTVDFLDAVWICLFETPSASSPPSQQQPSAPVPSPSSGINVAPGCEATVVYAAAIRAPEALAVGPDGSLYVADSLARQIVRIAPGGSMTVVMTEVRAMDLAMGDSGEILVMTHDEILRLSTSGDVVTIASAGSMPPLGASGATFFAVTRGPTGDLLIADKVAGALYRIDNASVISVAASGIYIPTDIAFGPSGDLYVAERGNNRIVRVDDSGVVTPFAAGQFTVPVDPQMPPAVADPLRMAFGPTGDLYVHGFLGIFTIAPNGAVSDLALNGDLVADMLPGRIAGDLAFDGGGNLYAANPPGGQVYRVATDGSVSLLSSGFNPNDIAVEASGYILAIDSEAWPVIPSHLVRFGPGGYRQVLTTFAGEPVGLAVGPDGAYYVSLVGVPDVGGLIVKVLADGSIKDVASGLEPGRIAFSPTGELFVALGSGDIVRLQGDGSSVPYAGGLGPFAAIGFDAAGRLYATDSVDGALLRISDGGGREVLASIPDLAGRPNDIAVGEGGDVYIASHGRYILWHVGPDGSVHQFASQLVIDPFGIDQGADGSIYVSQSGSIDRIQCTQ